MTVIREEKSRIQFTDREVRRFRSYTDKPNGEPGCWEWMGPKDPKGYGSFYVTRDSESFTLLAHRAAFIIAAGPIPEGKLILHHCDNRAYINPQHLFPGSAQENMADMISKGRGNRQKLTVGQVKVIRVLGQEGRLSYREIATMFDVSEAAIATILERRSWAWLKEDFPIKEEQRTSPKSKRSSPIYRAIHSWKNAKLDPDKIKEIFRLYKTGDYSRKQLAQMFGVSTTNVCDILKRKIWAWVNIE